MAEGLPLDLPTSWAHVWWMLARLAAAMVMGGLVALIYRRTRARADVSDSFTVTLVLLAILIAMVTQVIGDNVARAFSLVGALSIVRFRTVVRDTQDTAYVIFAVAIGMALGAGNVTVAVTGSVVVGTAALIMRTRTPVATRGPEDAPPFELTVRLNVGADTDAVLGSTLDQFEAARRLMSMVTARQGLAVDVVYRLSIDEARTGALVNALNRLEGVQSVGVQRIIEMDA